MPPKRKNNRRRVELEVTEEAATQGEGATQESSTNVSCQEASMDNGCQDTTVDASVGSGITSGRSSEPLTRQDIPVIIEEVTRQLHWDNDGSHASLTSGMCFVCVRDYLSLFPFRSLWIHFGNKHTQVSGSVVPWCGKPGDHARLCISRMLSLLCVTDK